MLLKKLKESPNQRLRNRFHDHPLLLTCQQVFRHYMAEMKSFGFTSEDLFIEVAKVIDSIFKNPHGASQYIEEMWDELKIELKTRENHAPPQEDLNTVCGALFYVVSAVLSLHWRAYYNTTIVRQLYKIIEHKAIFTKDGEQEEIINNLCKHAEGLEDWIIEYEDSEERLSDEIVFSLKDKKLFAAAVTNPQKSEVIINHLHKLMEGKSKPKDVMMPIRAAMDVGAIRRPTDEEFYDEFGIDRVKGKSSFNHYTNPDNTPYFSADFDAMKTEIKRINEE